MGPMEALNDTKLILKDQVRTSLVSLKAFRGLIFVQPVTVHQSGSSKIVTLFMVSNQKRVIAEQCTKQNTTNILQMDITLFFQSYNLEITIAYFC